MIQKLQKRFIFISMFSVFLVLSVIIGSINILNYQKVVQDAQNILKILSENNGTFPQIHPPKERNAREINSQKPPFPRDPRPRDSSPEMPYETRYFTVLLDESGAVHATDTGKIAAVDDEEASEYAARVLAKNKDCGFISNYRYLKSSSSDGILIIFLDCGRSLSTFRSFLLTSLLASLSGLICVFILVIFFSRLAMKPVTESYEKQRRFITDAGHELKTPLTIIDANREILEMEYGENEWSQGIQKQTARLAALTNSLVYLSRMEEEKSPLKNILFSISDLAQETSQAFQALAATQQKRFSTNIAPLLSYRGDEASIRKLFSILLDNAIKYSPPQGQIKAALEKRGKYICFLVYNETCEPISAENLSHLFDRFYRTDGSRNSETGGYGIGLSIAQAIVRTHKGKILARSEDGRSLQITVLL